jgi:hypothetical protein
MSAGNEILPLVLDPFVIEEESAREGGVRAGDDIESDVQASARWMLDRCLMTEA